MADDTVIQLRQPGSFSDDLLTDILRAGARHLLAQAIEAEVEAHFAAPADLTDDAGRHRIYPQKMTGTFSKKRARSMTRFMKEVAPESVTWSRKIPPRERDPQKVPVTFLTEMSEKE